ncbi:MAG: AAA family ATPase [Nitrososphaerota archaeon]|nr:AAA family ATPase [Nitrososphaerota archaeon]MDG6916822.1 AAA family ATPase [Nitrososphaerota archaeon]
MLRIVAVTGMPGAGKSTATERLVSRGWKPVVMGDVIRAETRRRGLEPDAKNTGEVMQLLRKERGPSAVADLCLEAVERSGAEKVVVDGIRSVVEVEAFRKKAKVLLVAVVASPTRRFELLKERGRSDDPLTYEMFASRDRRELDVGIGEAIALADETVSNQRDSPEALAMEMAGLVGRWENDNAA